MSRSFIYISRIAVFSFLTAVFSFSVKAQNRYLPNWESIDSRPTLQWITDAKFGIFVCWGLYSVPAWSPKEQYSEWYMYWLVQIGNWLKVNGEAFYAIVPKWPGKTLVINNFDPTIPMENG